MLFIINVEHIMLKNKANLKQWLSGIFVISLIILSSFENYCLAKVLNENQTISTSKVDKIISNPKIDNSSDKIVTKQEGAEDIVEIIVEDKPLEIPQDFQKMLQQMGITSMVLGDKQGKARLLAIDGRFINPCVGRSAAMHNKSTKAITPCRFQAGLGEALNFTSSRALMSASSSCDSCLGRGISRTCNVKTNKWSCGGKTRRCDTDSFCGD
jgi:hypothetical protein